MSLGVLNNLSAIYAENNLNNTSNSLNTVLQQLSSVRRSTPARTMLRPFAGRRSPGQFNGLTQSSTNAKEGAVFCKSPMEPSRK